MGGNSFAFLYFAGKQNTATNIMFAKRRADVRNLGFCAFYELRAWGKGSAI